MWDIQSNAPDQARQVQALVAQLPYVTSRALNDTANEVLEAERAEVLRAFDRPTPYTQNAFMVRNATKESLVATVEQKPSAARRNYLYTEAEGGPRRRTGFEGALASRVAIDGPFQSVLPADGAQIDQYGNWSKGQMTAVIAALGAMRDRYSNQTADSLARNQNRAARRYAKLVGRKVPGGDVRVTKSLAQSQRYFVPQHGLTPGVYSRDAAGVLRVILAFSAKAPVYEPRLRFDQVADARARAVFPKHFAAWLDITAATLR